MKGNKYTIYRVFFKIVYDSANLHSKVFLYFDDLLMFYIQYHNMIYFIRVYASYYHIPASC